jgi:hypothetical protein
MSQVCKRQELAQRCEPLRAFCSIIFGDLDRAAKAIEAEDKLR